MLQRFLVLTSIAAMAFIGVLYPQFAFAKKTFQDNQAALNTVVEKTGHEKTDPVTFTAKVVAVAFTTIGLIFLGLMVYAGFKMMTARGNEDEISTARSTIVNATIGLIVVVGSYAITDFVTTRLIQGKEPGSGPDMTDTFGEEPLGCCAVESNTAYTCSIETKSQCDVTCQGAGELQDDGIGGYFGITKEAGCDWYEENAVTCASFCEDLNQGLK